MEEAQRLRLLRRHGARVSSLGLDTALRVKHPKLPQPHETNYAHHVLLALGHRIVRDCIIAFSHLHTFDCKCVRVYHVNPTTSNDRETLIACPRHRWLQNIKKSTHREKKRGMT